MGAFTGTVTPGVVGYHACVLTTARAVYCWGEGGQGQLGDGDWVSSDDPVEAGF